MIVNILKRLFGRRNKLLKGDYMWAINSETALYNKMQKKQLSNDCTCYLLISVQR